MDHNKYRLVFAAALLVCKKAERRLETRYDDDLERLFAYATCDQVALLDRCDWMGRQSAAGTVWVPDFDEVEDRREAEVRTFGRIWEYFANEAGPGKPVETWLRDLLWKNCGFRLPWRWPAKVDLVEVNFC